MKKFLNKLTSSTEDDEPVRQQQASEELEAVRRQAMSQQGGPAPPQAPSGGRPPAPSPGAPPTAPPSFAAPGAGEGSLTPDSERQEITGLALEQLQERRRAPTEGVQLEGVPSPDIPSEVLRDNALNEILQRKERLDEEYRRRHGMRAKKSSGDAPKIFKGLKKKAGDEAEETAEGEAATEAPAAPEAPAASTAPAAGAGAKPKPKKKLKLRPLKSVSAPAPEADEPEVTDEPEPEATDESEPGQVVDASSTTTDEDADEALAAIKGVGPVTRQALLERFSSVEAIKQAEVEELTEVSGVGPALATRIKSAL